MSLPRETACTIEDIYALPDGQRAELIDGQIYMMTPPSYRHQRLVTQLSRIIGNYIADKDGDCEVLPAPFAVTLFANDETYVEPDISVICDKKMGLYLEAGVREYWIVDPAKERTTVYHYEEDAAPTIYSFDQPITVGIYGDLQITVSELLN